MNATSATPINAAGTLVLELPLQPAAVWLWLTVSCLVAIVLSAFWTTIAWIKLGPVGLLGTLPGLLLIVLAIFYWRRFTEQFACLLLDDGLLVRRGVWWRKEIFVPRSRIQHTEVNQGPYARRNDLAQVAVYTAGSHAAKIEVDGLAITLATQLRDQLLGRDGHDAV